MNSVEGLPTSKTGMMMSTIPLSCFTYLCFEHHICRGHLAHLVQKHSQSNSTDDEKGVIDHHSSHGDENWDVIRFLFIPLDDDGTRQVCNQEHKGCQAQTDTQGIPGGNNNEF